MKRPISVRCVVFRGSPSLCVLAVLALGGCVPFEAKFAAARNHRDPTEPLSGSWTGSWQSRVTDARGQARVVIEKTSDSTANLWLEMSGYRNVVASWIFAPDVPIQRAPDGTESFSIKVPLEARPKQDAWALAIQLDGRLARHSLLIGFRTNDAMREFDRGSIQLAQ